MKKIKYLLFLVALLLFPILVNAEGNVSITKIVKKDITGYAYEINPPTFNGLTINYDLSFNSVGDSITYIATVKNSDTDTYKIENKSSFSPSGYMTYEFKFSDDANTIKPDETKDMFITIKYNKVVPAEKLVNGEYKEQNQMNLILVNSNGQIPNPNTKSTIFFILIIGLLLIVSIILYRKHKKISVLLLILALLVPITAYALKEIKITLNTQVVIEKDLKFCAYDLSSLRGKNTDEMVEPPKMYFSYNEGDIFENWFNNNPTFVTRYFGDNPNLSIIRAQFIKNEFIPCNKNVLEKYGLTMEDINRALESGNESPENGGTRPPKSYKTEEAAVDNIEEVLRELSSCSQNYTEEANILSEIKGRNEGCYYIIPPSSTATGA